MSLQARAARRREHFDVAVRNAFRGRFPHADKRSVVSRMPAEERLSFGYRDEEDALRALKRAETRGQIRRSEHQEPGYPIVFELTHAGQVEWFGAPGYQRRSDGTYDVYAEFGMKRTYVGIVRRSSVRIYRWPRRGMFHPWEYQKADRKRWSNFEFRTRDEAAKDLIRAMAP